MIEIRVGRFADKLVVHRNTVTNRFRGGKLKAIATVGKKYFLQKEALFQVCRCAM
jgi:predicted site-specific integrase-resolvase